MVLKYRSPHGMFLTTSTGGAPRRYRYLGRLEAIAPTVRVILSVDSSGLLYIPPSRAVPPYRSHSLVNTLYH